MRILGKSIRIVHQAVLRCQFTPNGFKPLFNKAEWLEPVEPCTESLLEAKRTRVDRISRSPYPGQCPVESLNVLNFAELRAFQEI